MKREEAAEKLHDLADSIEEGHIELEAGGDSVELHPSENLEFELEVEKETQGEISLQVEVEWSEKEENSVRIG